MYYFAKRGVMKKQGQFKRICTNKVLYNWFKGEFYVLNVHFLIIKKNLNQRCIYTMQPCGSI